VQQKGTPISFWFIRCNRFLSSLDPVLHLFLLGTILCGSNCQIIETCIVVLNYVHNLDWIQAVQNKVGVAALADSNYCSYLTRYL